MCGLIQTVDIVRKCIDLYKITDGELIRCISQMFYYLIWTTCLLKRDLLFRGTFRN